MKNRGTTAALMLSFVLASAGCASVADTDSESSVGSELGLRHHNDLWLMGTWTAEPNSSRISTAHFFNGFGGPFFEIEVGGAKAAGRYEVPVWRPEDTLELSMDKGSPAPGALFDQKDGLYTARFSKSGDNTFTLTSVRGWHLTFHRVN